MRNGTQLGKAFFFLTDKTYMAKRSEKYADPCLRDIAQVML